jgi:hypothetical protein
VILGADYKRQASFFKAFSFAAFRQLSPFGVLTAALKSIRFKTFTIF